MSVAEARHNRAGQTLKTQKKLHYQTSNKQKMAISFHVGDAGGKATTSNFHFTRENNWLLRLWVYKSINPPVILELRQAFSLSCFLQICSWIVSCHCVSHSQTISPSPSAGWESTWRNWVTHSRIPNLLHFLRDKDANAMIIYFGSSTRWRQ